MLASVSAVHPQAAHRMSPISITRPSVRRLAILAAAVPALAGAGAMVQPAIASACTCAPGQHESATTPGTCVPDVPTPKSTPAPHADTGARSGARAGSGSSTCARTGSGPRPGSGRRAGPGTGSRRRARPAAGRAGRPR
jgi:hypothetical protein